MGAEFFLRGGETSNKVRFEGKNLDREAQKGLGHLDEINIKYKEAVIRLEGGAG